MRTPRFKTRVFLTGRSLGRTIVLPFQKFMAIQAAGGIALLAAAVIALVWANSPSADLYAKILHTEFHFGIGDHVFTRSLHFWINEGLMTVFFFVVGLEIKRELVVGELCSLQRAALPLIAALGGMAVPAGLYMLFNHGTASAAGWAIPMATDIAFVVGALKLLGAGIPTFLSVFLVSLAIFDDLGAVAVIALFYGGELQPAYLGGAAAMLLVLTVVNLLGFRRPAPYLFFGAGLWIFVYLSGIHATVAGVALAATIPARSGLDTTHFVQDVAEAINRFVPGPERHYTLHLDERNQEVIQHMEHLMEKVEPPLQKLERSLHPWVSFGIMPLFALANCGVTIEWGGLGEAMTGPVSLGILTGLFIGKQAGIFAATWAAVKMGLVTLPSDVGMKHIYGGAILCGIGFTMSLFIADLSFTAPEFQASAKLSILAASLLSGAIGVLVLRFMPFTETSRLHADE